MSQPLCVVGTVATVPKLIAPPGRAAFCSFRLASTERRFDTERKQWVDGETNWFTVNTFRTMAEHAAESFAKGDRVVVNGRLRVRHWEKDDKSGTSVDIEADAVGHDLRWGVTRFTRRPAASQAPGGTASEGSPSSDASSGGAGAADGAERTDGTFGQSTAGTEQVGWLAATSEGGAIGASDTASENGDQPVSTADADGATEETLPSAA
ncbi:single-stranded DNA-binding protein [Leucobacter sp. USHLN153]|uniref:single-stranded DNA-binding protein n=1 Tax=Leucobacter sp. USHLN153 TaxID=3081268 RepID=UPI00301AB05C